MAGHLVWNQLSGTQWLVLAAFYALLFVWPALRIRRHGRRVGNPVAHYWFWTTLVLGPLGIFAYWQDRKIRARKGELWEGERAAGEGQAPPPR